MNKNIKESVISSPSRLHLGFYGLDDDYGYTFGSMGVATVSYTHLTLPTIYSV